MENEKKYNFPLDFLCRRASDPGDGDHSEYQIRSWRFADHFCGLQYFYYMEPELWTTFGLYTVFVIIELLLHTCHNYRQRREENHALDASTKKSLPLILGMDLLQLPLSLVFTRFMNLFSSWIPAPEQVGMRFVVLLCGIILTGIGAAMSLNMRIVPNPGDGIVQAIADTIRKPVGFTKNCFDLCNICITITVSLVFAHKLIGVGIGTVVAVLGVGRVIALFNKMCMKKMVTLAGVEY